MSWFEVILCFLLFLISMSLFSINRKLKNNLNKEELYRFLDHLNTIKDIIEFMFKDNTLKNISKDTNRLHYMINQFSEMKVELHSLNLKTENISNDLSDMRIEVDRNFRELK